MSLGPISILETRWWNKGNHSIRPLFEAVAGIHFNNPTAFYYDMFSDESSLKIALTERCQDEVSKIVYLATHGNDTHIGPNAAQAISRTKLRNAVRDANYNSQLCGLYLGTCYTGNTDTASFILGGNTNLTWVAGYTESVDWIEGSAIDMVFFHWIADEYKKNKSRSRGKLSDLEIARRATTETIKLIPGAQSKYGFNLYFNENGSISSVFSGR